MSTVAWILVVALVALAVVCVGLALSLRVSRARAARTEHLVSEARRAVRLQSGYVYHYAFAMLIGVAALVSWYLFAV